MIVNTKLSPQTNKTEQSRMKIGERWNESLTELQIWRHLPENGKGTPPSSSPNNPAVDLIKTMKWNNGEGEEGEKKVV